MGRDTDRSSLQNQVLMGWIVLVRNAAVPSIISKKSNVFKSDKFQDEKGQRGIQSINLKNNLIERARGCSGSIAHAFRSRNAIFANSIDQSFDNNIQFLTQRK